MFDWCRFVGCLGLRCVVFIVSLKCPFFWFKAHLQSSPCNRGIEGCIYLLWRADVRQSVLEAEFRDIRVTVSFVVVSC
jgi:hypothetical protein